MPSRGPLGVVAALRPARRGHVRFQRLLCGPLPDAVMSLSRMIASLHDDDGNVTVAGFHGFTWPGAQVTEEEFREESRVFDEVQLLGTGTIADRTLSKASINV